MPSIPVTALAFLLALVLTACAGAPAIKDETSSEFPGLNKVGSSGFATAYARPGARLPDYRIANIETLNLADIEIGRTAVSGTLRRDWQMTPERERALQQTWMSAMNRAFQDFTLAASGEKVLRIAASMTGVAPGRPTATTVGGGLQPLGSSQDVVEVFMEFRLYDQASGELLAVLRDSRTMISQAMSRTAPVGIQTMFNSWASLLHTRVSGR